MGNIGCRRITLCFMLMLAVSVLCSCTPTKDVTEYALPQVVYGELEISAFVGYVGPVSFVDLTHSQISSIWGQEQLTWEGLCVEDNYTFSGRMNLDTDGNIWSVEIIGYSQKERTDYPTFLISLAPENLPQLSPEIRNVGTTCTIWDTEVSAVAVYDCFNTFRNPENFPYSYYCVSFVNSRNPEPVGFKAFFYAYGDEQVQVEDMINRLVSQSLKPGGNLCLQQLVENKRAGSDKGPAG